MKITGTMINYYFHCKRQCYLFANRLNLEDNSEEVHIGRVLHEIKAEKSSNTEIAIENIRIDKLTDDYLVELKKSDADIEAVRWQVLYYLKILKEKGIERKGKIVFSEKNKQENKVIYEELTSEKELKLIELEKDINKLISLPDVPAAEYDKKCRKCAYYEYCYI